MAMRIAAVPVVFWATTAIAEGPGSNSARLATFDGAAGTSFALTLTPDESLA
jgi:hypothetical protein